MSQDEEMRERAVPGGRFARLGRMGGLAAGMAGRAALQGAGEMLQGRRPDPRSLVLTPGNMRRLSEQLADLRGAAMKLGQMLSMDAGDMLPRDLTALLERLQSRAHYMPGAQLKTVLAQEWGKDWLKQFSRFDVRPVAAASIGQVHRARTRDGRDLAIKIQYPGIRQSIDSDIDNVATLLRLSGLVPDGLDLAPMLEAAKRQLHEEADYEREAGYLARFTEALGDRPEILVPAPHRDLTTPSVLAMDFVEAAPIDSLAEAPAESQDRIMTRLIGLLFEELFGLGMMQTDPNFANFRYQADTDRVVLLDFGAAQDIPAEMAAGYRRLLAAGLSGNRDEIWAAGCAVGLLSEEMGPAERGTMLDMFEMSMQPLRAPGPFDFGQSDLPDRMKAVAEKISRDPRAWHIPPMDTLFIQRKFGGLYMLAGRMGARVDFRTILDPWL